MAKVPLPERGQPLDVTYLYSLVDAVNDLSTQVASTTTNKTVIDTTSAGKQEIKTSNSRIHRGPIRNYYWLRSSFQWHSHSNR